MSYKAITNFKPAIPQPQPPFSYIISFYNQDTIILKKTRKKQRICNCLSAKKKVEFNKSNLVLAVFFSFLFFSKARTLS